MIQDNIIKSDDTFQIFIIDRKDKENIKEVASFNINDIPAILKYWFFEVPYHLVHYDLKFIFSDKEYIIQRFNDSRYIFIMLEIEKQKYIIDESFFTGHTEILAEITRLLLYKNYYTEELN